MIIVQKDSEVMSNYVAANPVPAGENFGVFHDQNLQPAVLALSEDGILNLIITVGRDPSKVDFGKASALFPEGTKVQAFAVLQAPDSSLDICIATKATDSTSNFYLLHHITLDEIPGTMPSAKVTHGVFPTVDHIYMGHKSSDTETSLPLVMVAFKRPDRLTSTEDLSYVKFGKGATLITSWSLPVNPKKIYDVTLVTCPLGDGVFVLYEGFSGEMFLVFKVLDGDDDSSDDGFAVQIPCPEGATCLVSFLDPATAWTVLLVGGKAITAFTYKEYRSPKGGRGHEIDNLSNIADLKDLHISQTGENLRLWYTTSADAVYYYTTTTTSLSEGLVLPLLAAGQGGRISSLLSSRSRESDSDALVSSLLSVDEHGNLLLLQQDTTSRAWQLYPFWHASIENVTEVRGLMVRLHATVLNNDDGDTADLLPGCWLRVSSSGLVRCIINGRHTTLSPTPLWYQTDAKGVLNILLQTDDATIHQFAADAYRPANASSPESTGERNLSDPLLDPTHKLIPKLEGIQTADDVRGLKKPDGSPLLPDDISDDDANGAADAFKNLVASAKVVRAKDKMRLQAYHAAITPAEGRAVAAEDLVPLGFWGDVGDWFEGAWNWLTDAAEDVWHWTCELVGDVWHFVLKIGKEIYEIALTTVTSIVKGIIWVFKKIGALIKDVIEFLGYLFQWGDILDATDSVVAGFNAALDHGEDLLNSKNIDAHQWLEDIRTTILKSLPDLQSNDYEGARAGGDNTAARIADNGNGANEDDDDQVKAGVAYNWSTYYFTYGGGPTNAVMHEDSLRTTDSTEEGVVKLWDDIQGEVEVITKTVVGLAKDLIEFLNPSNYSVHDLINNIEGDVVNGMIDALQQLVDILFDALTVGISLVRDLANKVIDIPIISWLWKNVIARGRPLTLLNFCALLIAIPTTVLYKAKKKHAPPKLKGRLTKDTFSKYVNGQGDANLASDILGFSIAAGSAVVLVGGEFETLSLLADGSFEGLGLETIPIGPIDGLMNVLDSASITFDSVGGFATWPVAVSKTSGVTTTAFDSRAFFKYTGWGLTGADMVSSAVIKIVGKKKKLERPVVKRWKGTTAAVLSVPILCVSLAGNIMDAEEGTKKNVLIVDAFIETAAAFGSTWGSSVARWNNELENELMYIGLAVKQGCTLVNYGLKVLDFAVEHLD